MAYKQLLQQLSQELEKAHAAILAQRTEAAELREELKSSNAVALDLRSQLAECRQQMQTNSGNTFNPITSFLGAEYHDCQTQGRANLKRTPKPEYKTPAPEQKSEEIIFDLISDHGEEDLPV